MLSQRETYETFIECDLNRDTNPFTFVVKSRDLDIVKVTIVCIIMLKDMTMNRCDLYQVNRILASMIFSQLKTDRYCKVNIKYLEAV